MSPPADRPTPDAAPSVAPPATPDDPPFVTRPWRVERALDDGTQVVLRPIEPTDKDELRRVIRGLSDRTRYLRFHGRIGEPSSAALAYLTEVDDDRHVALVALAPTADFVRERGVGVARFVRAADDPSVAEAAVTVVDDAQGKGLGRVLLTELARAAQARRLRAFRAEVLDENAAMIDLMARAGARVVRHDVEHHVIAFEVPLERTDVAHGLLSLVRAAGGRMAVSLRRLLAPLAEGGDDEAEPEGQGGP